MNDWVVAIVPTLAALIFIWWVARFISRRHNISDADTESVYEAVSAALTAILFAIVGAVMIVSGSATLGVFVITLAIVLTGAALHFMRLRRH